MRRTSQYYEVCPQGLNQPPILNMNKIMIIIPSGFRQEEGIRIRDHSEISWNTLLFITGSTLAEVLSEPN